MKIADASGQCYSDDFNIESDIPLMKKFDPEELYKPKPTERQIQGILKKMGKRSKDDELNCGMCGYASCREKAIAVYEGKAEISMCLPFMKERAESLSDSILDMTPNAIIAVDADLKIQQINAAACGLFKITSEEIVGKPVAMILDEFDFVDMITSENQAMTKHAYLSEYSVYLEQEFRFDKAAGIVICVMKNITQSRQRRSNVMKAKVQAANMADEIVEKQLHVVHEIAALLGETAAETKAAVHNLKETIMMDSEDD
jgi:PAS domain S-box-containing protein